MSTATVEAKTVATLAARAALRGYELKQTAHGTFVVWRWNLIRELADVAAVEAFLARATGARES